MTTMKNHSVPVLYLVPLRLVVGLSFLMGGRSKIASGEWGAAYQSELSEFVSANLDNAFLFYRPFLEAFALPNITAFAILVAWGELLVGVSIFLGIFTRFGAAVGIFMLLNYTFAIGLGIWMPELVTLTLWAMFTILICSAGRGIGADQLLRSRRRIRLFT